MMNISLRATDNINDNASTSIQKGFGNDSTPEGFILQLRYRETTFEITFTCVILTIAFFGCIGNLATIGKIVYDPKYHKPTFAVIGQLALADFLSVTVLTFDNMTNFSKFLPEFTVFRDMFTFRCKIFDHRSSPTKQTTSKCKVDVFVFTHNMDFERCCHNWFNIYCRGST